MFNNFYDINDITCNYDDNMGIPSPPSFNEDNNTENYYYEENSFNNLKDMNEQYNLKEKVFIENDINQQWELPKPENFVNMNCVFQEKKNTVIKDNKTNINSTASRTFNSQVAKTEIKIKEKIFNIKKINKKSKAGRKSKNSSKKKDKGTHTKDKRDNIIMKIKKAIYNHSLQFLNNKLKNSKITKLQKLTLLKINKSIIGVHKKQKNLILLKMNLKDIFYNKISDKYSQKDKNHNFKTIDKILKENDVEIKTILNTSFGDILKIYTLKNENIHFDGFTKIDKDIEAFEKLYEDEEEKENYIKNYKYYAENFEKAINDIYSRDKKK